MEEFEESKKAFDEALNIQRDTLRNLPSAEGTESNGMQSNALLLSMASTLCNIGSIKLRWKDFDEATIALEEALLIQQSVLGDNHPTVSSTMDSIDLVETAKYCAENPRSPTDFLIDGADGMCNSQTPRSMAEMLGLEIVDTESPRTWFPNPCAPLLYSAEKEYEVKTDVNEASSPRATNTLSPLNEDNELGASSF
jgi:hypothetical protein